jgi:very-short-patch-repair endonuclease
MDGKSAKHPPAEWLDARIGRLAAAQHGVVARRQLVALGLSRHAIDGRVRRGRLYPAGRGVYAVGRPGLTRNGAFLAAVLACGAGAVLSHESAAALWGLPARDGPPHVTVPTAAGRRPRAGLVLHRSPLSPHEIRSRAGIPLTSPARTLVDLADVAPRRVLERALDEAEYLRLDCTGLAPRRGRPGAGLLSRVLAEHRLGSTRTRSELEERLLRAAAEEGLPAPEARVHVLGHEVDFIWRAAGLIVEMDGRAAHTTRRAFERDRARDAELAEAGHRVIRVTHARMERDAAAVAAQIGRLLAAATPAPRREARAGRRRS